ncbi:Trk family potassium uptake protein [Aerococcaceae bacterium DSM 111022]|nr:Trk family potassium uptake protein [Aerococcaceae bacterium DSM 111022]
MLQFKNLSVPQTILLGFATVILLGTGLLMLPISQQPGVETTFVDALFTATSAVCVTGQITLNTLTHWSYFGKTVIISLIEIGGLGFMSLVVMGFALLGRKSSIKNDLVLLESLNIDSMAESKQLMFYVIRFALTTQGLGALLLSVDFIPRLGWAKGIYYSLFHSISAFCNAGFDLFGDSLIGFRDNTYVVLVIAFLIFSGSFGFIVWRDVLTYFKNKRLLLHTKVVLMMVGIILISSILLIAFIGEQNPYFADLSVTDRIANYIFLAITPRTAGYTTVDYAQVGLPLVMITIILMFIGASSGSTGGGLKITTLFVLGLYFIRTFQGKEMTAFRRSIPTEYVRRALLLLIGSITLITVASLLLTITETIPEGFGLEYILMEVVSCFATVGLTMGLTPDLTTFGKLLLILVMFIGRVGILTFMWAFGDTKKESGIHLPEGKIMIG